MTTSAMTAAWLACSIVGDAAEAVMQARRDGVPAETILRATGGNPAALEIVARAYSSPLSPEEFRRLYVEACLRAARDAE